MWAWQECKDLIEGWVPVSSDAIHVLLGVFILLGAGLVMRRPIASWAPWIVVFVLACLNEFSDVSLNHRLPQDLIYMRSVKDMLLTLVLPTTLLVGARFRPQLFSRRPADA